MEEGFQIVFWYWFILASILGIIEILAPGVFFLWLALAALITGVIALIIPSMDSSLQMIIFGVLSVVTVYIAWKYMRKNPPKATDQPLLNQRSAQYVGKTYTLVNAISGGSGRIKLGDSTWRVEGPDAPVGSTVKVIGYDGPNLHVEIVSTPDGQGTASAENTAEKPKDLGDALGDTKDSALRDPLDGK